MKIEVENIKLDVWEEGYPIWFHITEGDKQISFTKKLAPAIIDALKNLLEQVKEG